MDEQMINKYRYNHILLNSKIELNLQIMLCIDDKTLYRYEEGLKMIVSNNNAPVLMVIDKFQVSFDVTKKFAYDLSNQKLFANKQHNVSYFMKHN